MKDTVWGDEGTRCVLPPDLPVARFEAFQRSFTRASSLAWGEHCTECSFPVCQFTCEFYTPRADLTCQRFEHGIEAVAGTKAQIYRVIFRKWGKLEAVGPVPLQTRAGRKVLDLGDRMFRRGLEWLPAPFRGKRFALRHWNSIKPSLIGQPADIRDNIAFVTEFWSPMREPVDFTVTFVEREAQKIYQRRFRASGEYGQLVIPVSEIAAAINLDAAFLVQIEPLGEAAGKEVYFGLMDFIALAPPSGLSPPAASPAPAVPAPKTKVVVWDLDDTVWDGTLVEDGVKGIRLRPEVRATIEELDRRGILQSIASKNDEELAMAALRHLGIAEYFLSPQIHWRPKSDAVRQIATELDLGLDTFIFIDDQAFERAEVSAALPMVRVLQAGEAASLPAAEHCRVPVTPESVRRRDLYRAEGQRKAAFCAETTDYEAFLRASQIVLKVSRLDAGNAVRVQELSQRTNQLNFCATRWSREEVMGLAATPERWNFVLQCEDRYGDYGIIGFASVAPDTMLLNDFFMSCRVQRKCVEHAFFQALLQRARAQGHATMAVRVRPSSRNRASLDLLTSLGFQPDMSDAGMSHWQRSTVPDISGGNIVYSEFMTESFAQDV